jgi:pSer/pThr/pTyr-binding forkhead associated (FHA) protein
MSGNREANPSWSLKVVKGTQPGLVYALGAGEVVLGNSVGSSGIDLAQQEGNGPRRMAPRQASVTTGQGTTRIRDLDSPGGTFVNKKRLLPGQAHDLKPGDVIQLGGVQLEFVNGSATAAKPPVNPASAPLKPSSGAAPGSPFVLKSGGSCRGWDDFLTVSAQRWKDLREELTSGRLADYCASIGRSDLSPSKSSAGSPDERLDAWLHGLPSQTPCRAELDLHPIAITVKSGGGGTVRRSARITNIGFGILRAKARIEPADATWLRIAAPHAGDEFTTIEGVEIGIEVDVPDEKNASRSASLVIEGNGGTVRLPVRIEPAKAATDSIEPSHENEPVWSTPPWRSWLEKVPGRRRLLLGGLTGLLGRFMIAGLGAVAGSGFGGAAALPGAALAAALAGGVWGLRVALKRGDLSDAPFGLFAGGVGGVIVALFAVALCQSIEPLLGSWLGNNPLAQSALWGLIGTAIVAWSIKLVPPLIEEAKP